MRLVVWNCRMALHRKWDALAGLHPDLAVVPESAGPGARRGAMHGREGRQPSWIGPKQTKGLSAFAFGDYVLSPAPRTVGERDDAMVASVSGPDAFTLVAVWARAPKYVQHLHEVLDAYAPILRSGRAVLAGDFNSNSIWDHLHGERCHTALVRRLRDDFEMTSAYHATRGETHGAETTPTYFQYGRGAGYHIDYVFLPERWVDSRVACEVAGEPSWRPLSDHRPLVVDFTPRAA